MNAQVDEDFLKYGVYVLDADAATIERELPWMIMRREGECGGTCESEDVDSKGHAAGCCTVSGCPGRCTIGPNACYCDPARSSSHKRMNGPITSTDSGDGRHPGGSEMDVEASTVEGTEQKEPQSPSHSTSMRLRSLTHPYDSRDGLAPHCERHLPHSQTAPVQKISDIRSPDAISQHQHSQISGCARHTVCHHSRPVSTALSRFRGHRQLHRCKWSNTIDFAQREKGEMRDLTRASEIISVWSEDDSVS